MIKPPKHLGRAWVAASRPPSASSPTSFPWPMIFRDTLDMVFAADIMTRPNVILCVTSASAGGDADGHISFIFSSNCVSSQRTPGLWSINAITFPPILLWCFTDGWMYSCVCTPDLGGRARCLERQSLKIPFFELKDKGLRKRKLSSERVLNPLVRTLSTPSGNWFRNASEVFKV